MDKEVKDKEKTLEKIGNEVRQEGVEIKKLENDIASEKTQEKDFKKI